MPCCMRTAEDTHASCRGRYAHVNALGYLVLFLSQPMRTACCKSVLVCDEPLGAYATDAHEGLAGFQLMPAADTIVAFLNALLR